MNDVDTRYREASLSVEDRVEILLAQMTLEEKAGLFFHTMIVPSEDGELAGPDQTFGTKSNEEYISGLLMNHFNLLGGMPSAKLGAVWHNKLQEARRQDPTRHPRHDLDRPAPRLQRQPASPRWPRARSPSGPRRSASPRSSDETLVERFGDIARQEYIAVGIRVALHPQIDLATEPRWARQLNTFGEDADLTSRLGRRVHPRVPGPRLGPDSVAAMTKHFPGGGPQQDGEDPHFAVRTRAGLPGRPVRAAPQAVRGGLRGRGRADHAVLRDAGRHRVRGGRLRLQQGRASPGCCASASASTASSAPTGACSPTARSWASRSRPAPGASSTSHRASA